MTHYHVATGFMTSGALLGFFPEKNPEAFSTWEAAEKAARLMTNEITDELREQGQTVTTRRDESGQYILEWEDEYQRGRVIAVIECDTVHEEVTNGV